MPLPPEEFIYLWNLYCDLAAGVDALTYTEIYSWSKLHDVKLTAFEIQTLRLLDVHYRSI